MNNMRNKILMTLALLLTAVGGAWAAEFTSLKVGDVLHVGDVINTSTNYTVYGYYLDASYQPATLVRADISGPTTITESETGAYYLLKGNDGYFYGVIQDLLNGYTGGYWPVTATSDGISVTAINPGSSTELTFAVHEGEAPLAVDWNASTKTGTFEMPAYDVELTPLYAPVAQWAKVENVDQLPTAIEGIFAGTDNAIVNAGTVVEGQGTVMYFATTDAEMTAEKAAQADGWLADVPTAEGYDGAQTVYVWYYIKGADAPQGQTATAENTFNDTEICAEPIKVEVLSNKFDINFNAANANTIEAGKATVTVGGTAATVTEGKLEGVKMGSEVKMTAKEGYKFRKVKTEKKAPDNTYQKWDADQKKLVATEIPAEATTVANANTDVEWAAGTYVVEGEVTINGTISLNGNVELIIKDGAKLTVNKYIYGGNKNLSIYGQAKKNGQLVVNSSISDAIYNITTLEVHNCQVTATSSKNGYGGFYNIKTFNVYGGLVDVKGTVNGYGISLVYSGSMNIYGGEVRAEGSGNDASYSYGIRCSSSTNKATVTVYGGKLWAGCANKGALNNITLTKDAGYTSGKIETSSDGSSWTEYTEASTPTSKYVRVGF